MKSVAMATFAAFIFAAIVCSVSGQVEMTDDGVYANANATWDADQCIMSYNELVKMLNDCKGTENPSLISWQEAETALFLLLAVVVVLLLLSCIVGLNYCADRKKKDDKQALVVS